MNKARILVKDCTGAKGTTAWVIWGHNHLNQRRQFATDGVFFWYQPNPREAFIQVAEGSVPDRVRAQLLEIIIEAAYRRSQYGDPGEVVVVQNAAMNFDVFVIATDVGAFTARRIEDNVWRILPSKQDDPDNLVPLEITGT